jgi:hypothetical protein
MSSKDAEPPTGTRAARTTPDVWSITGRLIVLYTASTGGMLLLSVVFLYWVLASNLAQESQQFLEDKIHVVSSILRDQPHDRDALENEVQSEVVAHKYTKYYVRVLDAEGWTLLETPGMADVLPRTAFSAAAGTRVSLGDGTQWHSPDGRVYHLLTAWVDVGQAGEGQRFLHVGLEISQKEALLATYRHMLAVVLGVGILCAAGAASVVARRGMRPLA